MRFRTRGPRLAILLILLLLGATMLVGVAEAGEGKGKGKSKGDDDRREHDRGDDEDDDDDKLAAAAGGVELGVSPSLLMIGGLGAGAMLLLLIAIVAAARARKPPARRVSRKSFESGHLAAVRARPLGFDDAVAKLQDARLGKLVDARWASSDRFVIAMKRRRGRGCDEIAGYLSGLFESAWATDVGVAHSQCGGRSRKSPCAFEITRASVGGRPGAGASTRES